MKQEEQPGAGRALAAPPHAALPTPDRFKKIHQLHGRAPLKGARRHLVRVNSGRLRERAGWVRVTLWEAAGVGPCAAARTKRPGRPRCRDQGGAGGRGAVALGVRASGREGEEEERGGVGWGVGCRPRRRSVARRQGGPLAGAAPGRGAGRGRSGWGMGVDGSRGAADSPRVRRARQTRRRGAGPLRCCSQRAGAGAGSARPLCRAAAAGGGGRAGGGAPRGACPRGRGERGRSARVLGRA